MADTIVIETPVATVLEVSGKQGPQGVQGPKGDPGDVVGLPLTTQGDTLYRGASENQRLPIGTIGQILKVSAQGLPSWANESGAVTSVNGQTGAVTVSVPTASSSAPSALGTAAAGTATAYAREDHIHSADLSDSAFRVVGSSDATKKVAFEVDGLTTATTRTITVPDKNITLDDSGDSRTPTAHAADHAAGTKAEYNDQIAGMTESVFIRADNAGTAGNSITLTFDGVDDIDTVLAAWNSANPSNQATLIEGDGSQVPDSDEQITLAGGAGDDPLFDQNLNTTDKPKFDGLVVSRDPSTTTLANAVHVANFVAQDNTNQAPLVVIGGTGNIEVYKDSAISKALAYGFAQPGQTATDDYIVSLYDGSAWNKRLQIAQSGTASVFGNLVVRDNTGNETATFDAQGNLTANRTYDLPDASGTLALTSDIPALGTGAGEAAEGNHGHGNITSDGKIGSTAGLPLVTTTAGAVTTLALGTAGQVLTVNSGANGVEFAAASGGGVTAVGASTADVFSVSGSDLVADDGGTIDSSDPFIKWDDLAGKLVYANPLSRTSGAFYVGLAPTTTALGTNSVNIQSGRDSATHLAKDASSVCVGYGARSTSSVATAIGHNSTSGNGSFAGGSTASAGNDAVAVGFGASGGNSGTAIGRSADVGGNAGVAIGYLTSVTAVNAVAVGYQVTGGAGALRAGFNTRPFSAVYWGGQTTDGTANVELNLDATATNRMVIAANTAVIADIFVIARRTDNTKFLSARRWVAIRRDGSNNTALIGAVQTIGTDQSEGSPTWTFTIDADDTASVESLRVRVTGAAAETVNWRVCAIYRVVT